jgi:hypothetical protein
MFRSNNHVDMMKLAEQECQSADAAENQSCVSTVVSTGHWKMARLWTNRLSEGPRLHLDSAVTVVVENKHTSLQPNDQEFIRQAYYECAKVTDTDDNFDLCVEDVLDENDIQMTRFFHKRQPNTPLRDQR